MKLSKYITCIILMIVSIKTSNSQINPEFLIDLDSLVVDDKTFYLIQNLPSSVNRMNFCILDEKRDTLYQHDGYATNGYELIDFNEDGRIDIQLHQLSNVGGVSDLILYDHKTKTFRNVKNFYNFPSPIKIDSSNLWYSYHSNGCADLNWGSELFYIDNFEAIQLGFIEGIGCFDSQKNGLFVYQHNRTLVDSILLEFGYFEDKWVFINDYWTKNYSLFQPQQKSISLRCNINIVSKLSNEMTAPSKEVIVAFLQTFDPSCEDNVEFQEYSNEVLFTLLQKHPNLLLEAISSPRIHLNQLIEELHSPISDNFNSIDISEIENRIIQLQKQ